MTQLFTASEYAHLHSLVFNENYAGYKPNVVESPNGDGRKDEQKRYAHIAEKYTGLGCGLNTSSYSFLNDCLDRAHDLAMQVAITIGVPREFWPVRKYSALRVLEYNSEAITNEHTDFDLFTLMCYRNIPNYFIGKEPRHKTEYKKNMGPINFSEGLLTHAKQLNAQLHFGEILEEVDPNTYRATPHEVVASNGPWQYSVVYFSIPSHEALLPSGITVGKWLEERISRSRYER
jgi:isopenicillin N synthase-like dioxygenase